MILLLLPLALAAEPSDCSVTAQAERQALIDAAPRSREASVAAAELVDCDKQRGDLEALRQHATRFRAMRLGEDDMDLGDRTAQTARFAELEEAAAFKLAEQQRDAGDAAGAAEAFLRFVEDYPASERARPALLEAGRATEAAGDLTRAMDLYDDYTMTYPASEPSPELLWRLAEHYRSVGEAHYAAQRYDALTHFPRRTSPERQLRAHYWASQLGPPEQAEAHRAAMQEIVTFAKDKGEPLSELALRMAEGVPPEALPPEAPPEETPPAETSPPEVPPAR